MRTYRRAGRMPRRAAGVLVAAASLAAGICVILSPPAMAARTGSPGTVEATTVASGPARSLGEPAAAHDAGASAVTATSFGATGAQAVVWTRHAGARSWRRAGSVLPAGLGSSYDPAAAAVPGGPLLVVAGTAPPGENCIASGSVAIASVDSRGRLGASRLVSDQRGTGSFDDRPMVAAGQHGTVWVAWSQGPDADACQDVGTGDRIEVAVSHDAGRTFGVPVAMATDGGHSAFGVRLAPVPGGRVAVSWTETMPAGDQGVLVSVLSASGHPGQPQVVMVGHGPPLLLPGASFYDFPAGDVADLPGGELIVAAPFWASGRSVIKLAAGAPGGRWQQITLGPPAGADLLLPALSPLPSGGVRVLCAVHTRAGDRLRYDWADVTVTTHGSTVSRAGLTPLTPAPAGPGFFEIGEELTLSPGQGGLLTAVVVAGQDGATLEAITFRMSTVTTSPGSTSTPSATRPPEAPGRAPSTASTPPAASGQPSRSATTVAWLAAAAAAGVVSAASILVRWRHRMASGKRHRPSRTRR